MLENYPHYPTDPPVKSESGNGPYGTVENLRSTAYVLYIEFSKSINYYFPVFDG